RYIIRAYCLGPLRDLHSFPTRRSSDLSLAIFAGVYRLLCNDRRFAAGLVAGLLWFIPQLLLGLFIWWAFQPRRYFPSWLGVFTRSEEHTSELQSRRDLVCRLLLEKKKH